MATGLLRARLERVRAHVAACIFGCVVLGDIVSTELAGPNGTYPEPGVGPSLLSMAGGSPWVLGGAGMLAALALAAHIARRRREAGAPLVPVSLLASGLMGNALDRLVHGTELGLWRLTLGGLRWPALDLADVALVVGAVWLVWCGGSCARCAADARESS